jgi:ATP-dependent DNA helicase RecG
MKSDFLNKKIEFIAGVGPSRSALLNKEIGVFTINDMLNYFPFRYEDRSKINHLSNLTENSVDGVYLVQALKKINSGVYNQKRLTVKVKDSSGYADLIWFKGVKWIDKKILIGRKYLIFGKPKVYKETISFTHPETNEYQKVSLGIRPVYSITETLKKRYINNVFFNKIIAEIIKNIKHKIDENLPKKITQEAGLLSKENALINIHLPKDHSMIKAAIKRLKYEELFYLQLQVLLLKKSRLDAFPGYVFKKNIILSDFYKNHIPFSLTSSQKNVIKECYKDMSSGKQMNRLIQGDVGSGKTIVAFMCMLISIEGGGQVAFMAPTEVLAEQHFQGIKKFAKILNIQIDLLTGSTKQKERKLIHDRLIKGETNILIGTHALIQKSVVFKRLGLVVIDEQHKFGVAQRAKLWRKKQEFYPHILVMTATPIPRTLALTLYGDLDVSTINELPTGRIPIITSHRFDNSRLKVFSFIKKTIKSGQQVYIVYPLIEESKSKDYKDLMDGYESIKKYFPNTPLGILHGRMKAEDKDFEMKRFVDGKSKILVSTTVIEVGVDVSNASVMVIESAERFGLSQLHQLRGRVGRGVNQSYCILMTKYTLNDDSKIRINALVDSSDGFEIANIDLKLRGPGNMMGTEQSGVLDLKFTDLTKDSDIIFQTRVMAKEIIKNDPELKKQSNQVIFSYIKKNKKNNIQWSRVS